MKYVAGIVIGLVIAVVAIFVMMPKSATPNQIATSTQTPQATSSALPVASVSASPSASPISSTGTISGKLCYPSSFLPAGAIEAKSTINNMVTTKIYPGTAGGGTSQFSIDVQSGTYVLRYKAQPDANSEALYGYYTDVCSTGMETTCAATNDRENKKVTVTAGQEVTGVNLCDFYYDNSTNPGF
jgi:hypothetical protein